MLTFLGMALMLGLYMALVFSLIVLFCLGTYTCFSKKWYFGLIALLVPAFAVVVSIAKLFNKDLLN